MPSLRSAPRPASRRGAGLALAGLAVLAVAGLASPGCAIYDDEWTGDCILDCQPPTDALACAGPSECLENETCGEDGRCHSGNCRFWGCVEGYGCEVTDRSTAECVPGGGQGGQGAGGDQGGGDQGGSGPGGGDQGGGGGGGEGGEGGAGGSGGGPTVTHCGNPDDCGAGETCSDRGTCEPGTCADVPCVAGFVCGEEGACQHQNAAGCGEDADCTGDARCVSGLCTSPADLCFDQVQCPGGDACVEGKCTATCVDDGSCPDGFSCDLARGVCTVPTDPCERTADCGAADRVCVGGACVPRADGTVCPVGSIWVENGCLAEQRATFACTTDGEQAECAAGLICVHRTCFVSCDPPDQGACAAIPGFEQCKEVATAGDTFAVCGSDANLGGECDPTLGVACDQGLVCIDGSCR